MRFGIQQPVTIREHHDALGVDDVMGAFNGGGGAPDRILRSMRMFGEKVVPRPA